MNKTLNTIGRLALTLGTIGAIGWGFVALNPPDSNGDATIGVQESSADIFSMSFAERTSTQKFQAALDDLGHEKPRVYDYNGNTVMFSTNLKRGTIDQVFRDYMQEFADQGLNPFVFQHNVDPQNKKDVRAMLDASVSGGVIPWVVRDDYMALGGAVLDAKIRDQEDLHKTLEDQNDEVAELLENFKEAYDHCGGDPEIWKAARANPDPKRSNPGTVEAKKTMTSICKSGKKDPGGVCDQTLYQARNNQNLHATVATVLRKQPELRSCRAVGNAISSLAGFSYDDFTMKVKAFRSIEAWYDQKSGLTRITASWSDETFDATKAQPSRYGGVVDTQAARKIPLCPGCRRITAINGTGAESGYSSNVIISPNDPVRTANFYTRELQQQGWEIPESELVVQEMQRMAGEQTHDTQWLRMRRGNEYMALVISRDDEGRTKVRATTAP
jgi:hypothetical protein